MSLFNPYEARPGLPYRATEDAAVAAFLGFIIALFAMNLVVGPLRPAQGATFLDHLLLPLKNTSGWLRFMTDYPLKVGAWYLITLTVPMAAAVMIFTWANRERDPYVHVRGRRLLEGKAAIKASRMTTQKLFAESKPGLKIGANLQLSWRTEAQSVLALGAQGGGKTVIGNYLLQASIHRGDKQIIYDLTKADFTGWVPGLKNGEAVLISPWDRRSFVPAIGEDLRTVGDAEAFAAGLIPESDEPMWSQAARSLLVAGILFLIDQYQRNWGWRELASYCFLPITEQKLVVDAYYAPGRASVADVESKTSSSVKITADTFAKSIWAIARAWAELEAAGNRRFSMREWLNDDNHQVRRIIIHGNAADPVLTQQFALAFSEYYISRIVSLEFPESSTRRLLVHCDELPQVGRLNSISRLLQVGRSKGVFCFFGFQSEAQVKQIYPPYELDKWEALFGLKIFPKVVGSSSQEWVCRQVGKRIVERRNRTVSGFGNKGNVSDNWQRQEINVIEPTELADRLGPDRSGVNALVIGHGNNALILRFPFNPPKVLRKGFIAAKQAPIQADPPIDHNEASRMLGIAPLRAPATVDAVSEPIQLHTQAKQAPELVPEFESIDDDDNPKAPTIPDDTWPPAVDDKPESSIDEASVSDALAGEIMSQALEHATGIPAAGEILDLMADLSNLPPDVDVPPPSPNPLGRRKRAKRKDYAQASEAQHEP